MALRKLQAEIDKTLKTVALGVETFESTFDKLGHATNSTQKDKLENDLKTQIKKLQRMRDQIKAWLGSSDIKDKTALMENRRLIETQMERFKALEKEMKMKAFSKEGLSAQSKLDPAEKAKREMIDWVGTMTEELARQIEATEAELEGISTAKKKKGSGERVTELEELNERRSWHIGRLEIVQRMLDNGQLQSEQVESIQEDVKYFVESNADEDFDYDQGLYDDLNLLDEEDFGPGEFGLQPDDQSLDSASLVDPTDDIPLPAPKTPAKEDAPKKTASASKSTKDKDSALGPSTDDPPSPILSKKTPSRKSTMDSTKQELPKLGISRDSSVPPVPPIPSSVVSPNATASTSTPTKAPLPPIRYAAAAAAAVAATAPMLSPSEIVTSPTKAKAELPVESPALEIHPPPTNTTVPPSLAAQVEQIQSATSIVPPPTTSAVPPPPGLSQPKPTTSTPSQPSSTLAPPDALSNMTIPPLLSPIAQTQPSSATSTTSQSAPPPPPGYPVHPAESSRSGAAAASAGTAFDSPRPASQQQQPQQQQQGVLGSLMQSFDAAKEMLAERRGNDISQLHQALEVSYRDAPLQADSEPPRYYIPKNPAKTPAHYPQTRATNLTDRSIYDRFEVDQLFFIFYYYSGSYEQCLAAEKLKQHNWRFHKQYLTWFKRAHNPQAITEDYEQGGYYYFDWENSWCQRKKSDFRFEYRWLSDN